MEKRTFADAEVVRISETFLCVEVDAVTDSRLADRFGVDSLPRAYVLDSEGTIIGRRDGYVAASEFADWLTVIRTKAPPVPGEPMVRDLRATMQTGSRRADSDLVIWFIDSARDTGRWGDEEWIRHAHLISLLRAAGFKPRIEHLSREEFPDRWDHADDRPDLISARLMAGLVKQLSGEKKLVRIDSERMTFTPEAAICSDFAKRTTFLIKGSPREARARLAISLLLGPAPDAVLKGEFLTPGCDPEAAASTVRRVAVAYVSGNSSGLSRDSSPSSPQLTRCTHPTQSRVGFKAEAGTVEIRGSGHIAFARVEMRYQNEDVLGADPFLVVLRREADEWKALAISKDSFTVKELSALCELRIRPVPGQFPPPIPSLKAPVDNQEIGKSDPSFSWTIPDRSSPPLAQICQVLLDEGDSEDWPATRMKIYPGTPLERSLKSGGDGLAGISSDEMWWCVWTIGTDGQVSVSSVERYRPPGLTKF